MDPLEGTATDGSDLGVGRGRRPNAARARRRARGGLWAVSKPAHSQPIHTAPCNDVSASETSKPKRMAGVGRVHSDDRVRGKSRDQRRRDRRREQRKNAEVAGIPKHRAVTLKTSADGKRIVKSLSAKKIKKKDQRLRLLSKSGATSAAAMDI